MNEAHSTPTPYTVVGAVVQPYHSRKRWARGRLSWPFARLELREREIVILPRGFLERVFPSFVLPIDTITGAERIAGITSRIGDGIRFRSTDQRLDGIVFSTLQPNARRLQQRLRDSGIEVR
jgi:hypothetical protein